MITSNDFKYSTTLKPTEAIKFFKKKDLKVTYNWRELDARGHLNAFTVAKETNLDTLDYIKKGLDKALKNGDSFDTFKKEMQLKLPMYSKGKLNTIYRTNMQNAYAAGRWRSLMDNADYRPFGLYDAVMDGNTRPTHAALNGVIKQLNDPFWDEHAPPNGFNCRCILRSLSKRQAEARGITNNINKKLVKPDDGWAVNPASYMYKPSKWQKDFDKLMTREMIKQKNVMIAAAKKGNYSNDVVMSFFMRHKGAPSLGEIVTLTKDTEKMKVNNLLFRDTEGYIYDFDFSGVDVKKIKAVYILLSKEMTNPHDIWKLIADRFGIRYSKWR
jgi:SPP1 gp7 family putative phage head morphogenesis protein